MESIRQATIDVANEPDAAAVALTPVAGVPGVKRQILTLKSGGITRVVVIAGGAVTEVKRAIEADDHYARAGVEVTVVENPPTLDGRVLAVPSGFVFDAELVKRAAATDARGENVVRLGEVALAGGMWVDARTAAGRAEARRTLLRSLSKPTDGPIARHINRRFSGLVTRMLLDTRVTPNQMTIVANLIGFVGIWLCLRGTWAALAGGAALVQVQSILDGCDGELARLKFQGSKLGEWLDNVLDDTINILYGAALGEGTAILTGDSIYRWLGVATAASYIIYNAVLYIHLWIVHRRGNPFLFRWWFQKADAYLSTSLADAGIGARLVGVLHAMGRRDLFLFAFLLACAAKLPQIAVFWYAAIAVVGAVLALVHVLAGGISAAQRAARPAA